MFSRLNSSLGFAAVAQSHASIPCVLKNGIFPTLPVCGDFSLLELSYNHLFNTNAVVNKQFVCFKYRSRKPANTPRSRKKRYWVAKSAPYDPVEYTELFWRYANYRTLRRNLNDFFRQRRSELNQPPTIGEHAIHADRSSATAAEAAEPAEIFEQLLQANEEQNNIVGAVREAYFQQRHEQLVRYRHLQAAEWTDFKNEMRGKAVERIKHLTEESKTFVYPDNIDAAIDEALDNVTELEYAIDTQGRKYWGRPQFNESGKLVVFNIAAPTNQSQTSLPLSSAIQIGRVVERNLLNAGSVSEEEGDHLDVEKKYRPNG